MHQTPSPPHGAGRPLAPAAARAATTRPHILPNPDAVVAAADLDHRRWRAEVALLGAVAPIGRWGLALARRAGVTSDHFANEDTAALWVALECADDLGRIADREMAFAFCRRALKWADCWSAEELRFFVCGSRWGPGPLTALFTRLGGHVLIDGDEFVTEAEQELPRLAAELLAIAGEWDSFRARVA